MRRLTIWIAALLLCGAGDAAAGKPHATLRVHLEGEERDGAPFVSEMVSPFSGRRVVVQKVPAISERDVVAFRPYDAPDGSFGALFQLDDHGRLALDSLSVEKRGGIAFVVVNGRLVAELQIDRRVSDGQLYIAKGLTASDIQRMKKQWALIGQRRR